MWILMWKFCSKNKFKIQRSKSWILNENYVHRYQWLVVCSRSSGNAIVVLESKELLIQLNYCSYKMDSVKLLCSLTLWSIPMCWFVWNLDSDNEIKKKSIILLFSLQSREILHYFELIYLNMKTISGNPIQGCVIQHNNTISATC